MCKRKRDSKYAVKNAVLPIGFIIVDGPQGIGKTSFCTALIKDDFRSAGAARRAFAEDRIIQLRKTGDYPDLKCPAHLYWSNVDIRLHKELHTFWIDTHVLGLPNQFFAVQYFPRGSVVYISEADVKLWCRDWSSLNPYLKLLLKYVRHNYMTIIFDLQVNGELDKALRGLQTERYSITSSYQKGFFIKKTIWKYEWCRPQLIAIRSEHAQAGRSFKLKTRDASHSGSYRFKGNIYQYYNSFTGEAYFLDGLQSYSTLNHPSLDLSKQNIKVYCDMFPLIKPKEMKKQYMNEILVNKCK